MPMLILPFWAPKKVQQAMRPRGQEMKFLFQMQAMTNIELLNAYQVKKIVTCDPHSFNTLKNEYPGLGGNYEVYHHTQYIKKLIEEGRLNIEGKKYKNKRITFHDPCYLGRANEEYNAPRELIRALDVSFVEMHRNKSKALCCGAGGAQMFKEPEKGNMDINVLRTEDALKNKSGYHCHRMPLLQYNDDRRN